jgi:hypothetical protein
MPEGAQSSDAGMLLQTLRPKFHWRVPIVFGVLIGFLGYVAYAKAGVEGIGYGGLAAVGAVAMFVQYRRERALTHNRLSAVGVVTDYRIPFRGKSRILNFIVARFYPEVPRYKYTFVAFDQKTYGGETGWGSRGLSKGAKINVLYDPENPARNHPHGGFIFYSFQ